MDKRLNVELIEVSGFVSCLRALRLPFGKEVRSQGYVDVLIENNTIWYSGSVTVDPKDMKLLKRLITNGDEHAKVMRGIRAHLEISAPIWWWVEMDTYRAGTERLSSESTMHIDSKGLSGEELMAFKDELKEGKVQKRIQDFSYQTLKRIYKQRYEHRLPIWHDFCSFIESLPMSELITGK